VRIEAAQIMLRRTRRRIEQIASQVGYNDVRSFRAAFREHRVEKRERLLGRSRAEGDRGGGGQEQGEAQQRGRAAIGGRGVARAGPARSPPPARAPQRERRAHGSPPVRQEIQASATSTALRM
jgi:hypothetical protein